MGSEKSSLFQRRQPSPGVDDFTRIQGIGPVIARQLYDAGILTYAQLAALSPEQIVRLIKNLPLLSVERIARQDWPGQARALAAESTSLAGSDQAAPSEPLSRYATFTVELLLDDAGQVRRTRVIHVQDGEEEIWSGWDEGYLLRFFAAHAALEESPANADAPPAVAPGYTGMPDLFAALPSRAIGPAQAGAALAQERSADQSLGGARLEICDLRIDEATPDQSNAWPAVPRVRARLSFRLNGPGAAQVAAQAPPCITHIVAYDLASGKSIELAAGQDRLVPTRFDYTSVLEFALPDDGRYQLVGIVLIALAQLVDSVLGPVLRVVP